MIGVVIYYGFFDPHVKASNGMFLYGMFYILDFLLVFVNMLLVVVIFRECFSSESENGLSNHWT